MTSTSPKPPVDLSSNPLTTDSPAVNEKITDATMTAVDENHNETATVDDETIARLLQAEFDQESMLIASTEEQQSAESKSPVTQDSQPFAIAGAREAVRAKFADFVSYIRTEASKAGQSLQTTTAVPTSPGSVSESTFERSIPLSPASPNGSTSQFEFSKFLEQMRDRRALPLTKYFRSFLREFTKRSWTVNEQIKIVRDFLDFMAVQVAKNEMFIGASDAQLENASEGIEKLLMNKLHQYTFSPSTSDDAVKDEVLFKKISILQWIELKHLDIHLDEQAAEPLLRASQKELLKVNDYKAPRDKLICILNACKLIFGLIKQSSQSENADTFLPLLIYVVLKANPPHLHSNVQYISRFRNPSKLASEAGYYLTNVQGAMSFIESLDHTALSIEKPEFDSRIEQQMRTLEDQEAERRAKNALAALDDGSPAQPATSPGGGMNPQLEQLATNVKRPIEYVSRWISQAAATLTSSEPTSPVTPGAAGDPPVRRGSEVSKEMHTIDLSHLTPEERALMTDYELQLAMAMSMSLEEERGQWEKVPPSIFVEEPGSLTKAIDLIDFEHGVDEVGDDSVSDVFSVEAAAAGSSSSKTLVSATLDEEGEASKHAGAALAAPAETKA